MAINPGAVWEYGSGGNNNYGGGFDSTIASSGTDYSQQDTPILSLEDIECEAGSTTITSDTGGFTSAMIGNALNLYVVDGTGNLIGFYFITGVTDTNTATIDRAIGASDNMTSGDGNIGGRLLKPIDAHLEAFVGGNKIWIQSGNYTMSESIAVSSTSASNTAPIIVEGYKTTRGDYPKGTDRPSINTGAYTFYGGGWWVFKHLDCYGNNSSSIMGSASASGVTIINCKAVQNATTGTRYAMTAIGASVFYLCEMRTYASTGGAISVQTARVINCYIHDSYYGVISSSGTIAIVIGNIFDTCTTGYIPATGQANGLILGNVFYNSTTHVDLNTSKRIPILHNIFHTSTTAITDSTNNDVTPIHYNLFYNNTTNGNNVTIDSTNITGQDPLFTDAANGDFTLQAGSPALNAGPALTMAGLTGAYKLNIGVDQDDNSSGGTSSYAFAC